MIILVINSGSSSLKWQVREGDEVLAQGLIESIGEEWVPDHAAAIEDFNTELAVILQGRPSTRSVTGWCTAASASARRC
jgi:acetate kinase